MRDYSTRQRLRAIPLSLLILTYCCLAWLPCSTVLAQPQASNATTRQLETVIDQLIKEANDLDELDTQKVKHKPVFERPHPLIEKWDATSMGPAVLDRLGGKFTDNDYRDTYIRWHLIYMVKQRSHSLLTDYLKSGKYDQPKDVGAKALDLLRSMPPDLNRPWKRDYTYEPYDIYEQWEALRQASAVVVGYPPFDRRYYGQQALQHATPEQRAKLEPIVAKMDLLRQKFRRVNDAKARTYNLRRRQTNMLIREYRGDLIYILVQTGDPAMLNRVVNEIGKQVGNDQWYAFDLARYFYLAAFDGYLQLYDAATLTEASKQLESLGRKHEGYKRYMFGKEPVPSYFNPNIRDFADYIFNIVHLMRDPGALQWFNQTVHEVDSRVPARSAEQVKPESFTTDDVQAARQRAIAELQNTDSEVPYLQPPYELIHEPQEQLATIHSNRPEYQRIVNVTGNQALACWAMLAAGENYQDPRLYKRINWVLSSDTPYTFDRAMRLQMLAMLPYQNWKPWIRRDVLWMDDVLDPETGNFSEQYEGKKRRAPIWGDHANGQYGVLGLWAAQRAGHDIPNQVWKRIDQHWRKTQQNTPGDNPAGWALGMLNVDERPTVNTASQYRVDGPMTAGGTATLSLTERYLYGSKRISTNGGNVSSELRKGIAWLDQNFDLHDNSPTADWYYYMWTIQRVGEASGYRTFNGVDWFRQITAEILNRQEDNGLWSDPNNRMSELVSTGFALLYLANSYAPIAVSKIRYDGNWNNRPHDLWNFSDYASNQYEVKTGWQIVEADQPVYQLIESPILYLAGSGAFQFNEQQIQNLRGYIDAGGLLVLNPDTADADFGNSVRELAVTLFPNQKLKRVDTDSRLYQLHQPLRGGVQMLGIDNGIRPQIIQFVRDIGEGLQTNDTLRSDSFSVLSNLYLNSIGMNPRRTRMQTHYLPAQPSPSTIKPIRIARLSHDGSFDPEPAALEQLSRFMVKNHGQPLTIETIDPSKLAAAHKVAFLTNAGAGKLTDAQAQAINRWLKAGGTLWIDAAGGSQKATEAAMAMVSQIMPNEPASPLARQSQILTGKGLTKGYDNSRVQYRLFALHSLGPTDRPNVQAVRIGNRPAILLSLEDITTGLAGLDHWGIFGYTPESARQLVANSLLMAK